MTHVLRQDWIDDTPPAGSSSGLIVFGLVLGVLLLVPLLMMCGDSSGGTRDEIDALIEASPPAVTESSQTISDGAAGTAQGNISTFAAPTTASSKPNATNGTAAPRGTAGTQANAAATPEREPAGQTYVVADGDTLWDIANRFGVTVEALTSANGLSADAFLQPGESITIPAE